MLSNSISSVCVRGLALIVFFCSVSILSGWGGISCLTFYGEDVESEDDYYISEDEDRDPTYTATTKVLTRDDCGQDFFKCESGRCIHRSGRCDGLSFSCQYSDNSDETFCNGQYNSCPSYATHLCADRRRCIPAKWLCDGVTDCRDGSDEISCNMPRKEQPTEAKQKALQWLLMQRNKSGKKEKWGYEVARIAASLYIMDHEFFKEENETGEEIGYELTIQLLSDLFRDKTQKLSASDLAVYLNGLIVSCIDPKNFHGLNVLSTIRERFDENVNSSSPFALLSLCIAGDKMTQRDVDRLIDYEDDPSRPAWTGHKALTLMALTCIKNQKEENVNVQPDLLRELAVDLAEKQFRNGSIENLPTTGLVVQALNASNLAVDEWVMDDAIRYLLSSQSADGSFGNLLNTYYILPVLNNKTLIDISASHCQLEKKQDEALAVKDLHNKLGSKIFVMYTLWIGDEVDVVRALQLRVVANSSLFDVMDLAAEIDPMYKFEYTMLNRKPYVYLISKIQDNPENNKFWFLYKYNEGKTGLIPLTSSPVSIIPKNKEEYVLWYRTKNYGAISSALKNLLS